MNEDQFLRRKPKRCPKCGFSPVASILYGMPAYDDELERKLEDKSLVLGRVWSAMTTPSGNVQAVVKNFTNGMTCAIRA